jgi:glutaredoxin
MTPIEVVVVSAPACHLCADAQTALAEMAHRYALNVRAVEASSEEGRRVVAEHRPAMFPMVLVDGAVFSVGRLPRGKLRKLIEARAA